MKKSVVESEKDSGFKLFNLDISQISLIFVNLITLIGILFFSWDLLSMFLLFWMEGVIIGFYSLIKMLYAKGLSDEEKIKYTKSKNEEKFLSRFNKIIYPIFFIVHFTGFGILGGIFTIAMFYSFLFKIDIFTNSYLIKELTYLTIPIIIIFISHGISFYKNYLIKKEYAKTSLSSLMFSPYIRFFIAYYLLFFIGFLAVLIKTPKIALVLILVVKFVYDINAHNKEHNTPIFKDKI